MSGRTATEREAQRQQALLQAILSGAALPDGVAAPDGFAAGASRGLLAYRLNAQALAARALGAVHGRLRELLGEADFAAMAWAFWRQAPPQRGDLAAWGEGLAAFLSQQADVPPHLPDLARLEWALHAAERAADAELDAASLAQLAGEGAAWLRLCLRPGSCVLSVDAQALALLGVEPEGQARPAVLVWRQQWRGRLAVLPPAQAAFTQRVLAGQPLQQALASTLQTHADFAFDAWLQRSLAEGWLQGAQA